MHLRRVGKLLTGHLRGEGLRGGLRGVDILRLLRVGTLGSLAVGLGAIGRATGGRLSEGRHSTHLNGLRNASPTAGPAAETVRGEGKDDETNESEPAENVGNDASDAEACNETGLVIVDGGVGGVVGGGVAAGVRVIERADGAVVKRVAGGPSDGAGKPEQGQNDAGHEMWHLRSEIRATGVFLLGLQKVPKTEK